MSMKSIIEEDMKVQNWMEKDMAMELSITLKGESM